MVPHSVHQVIHLIYHRWENFKNKEKRNRYLFTGINIKKDFWLIIKVIVVMLVVLTRTYVTTSHIHTFLILIQNLLSH